MTEQTKIAVIGLGYVGLPLALEFSSKFPTIGFDTNETRINELKEGLDKTYEVEKSLLLSNSKLLVTSDILDIADSNVYIVAVPTPINAAKQPDLRPLLGACQVLGKLLTSGDTVIFESTVYPGATEEDCVPILEDISGLKLNHDFFCGYSPERINPGDKTKKITDIVKVTSGSNANTAIFVDELYKSIISAGTFSASSIKIAEAAKVIENIQRDVNIGLVNELSMIFAKLGISTDEVLEAASTKWNFLKFQPGLVGGHCIGVDPYYLTYKAQAIGHQPDLILAGRRVNDNMSHFVASSFIKFLAQKNISLNSADILILGVTFKENCNDLRNSKVFEVIRELQEYGIAVECVDPLADKDEAKATYGIDILNAIPKKRYDGIIAAVNHDQFSSMTENDVRSLTKSNFVVYDLKCVFDWNCVTHRL